MGIFDFVIRPDVESMLEKKDIKGLMKFLNTENWAVRRYAALGLGQIKDLRAVNPLIQSIKDNSAVVRAGVVTALGEIGDSRRVQPLIEVLTEDRNWRVRCAAATALGKIGDERALKPLVEASKNEDNELGERATVAIRKIKGLPAAPSLNLVIREEKDWVFPNREARTPKKKREMDKKVVQHLKSEVLYNEYWTVRRDAVGALGTIGDPSAVELLISALRDAHPFVREAAREALREIQGEQ